MLEPKLFFDNLSARGCTFFAGVPDSLLKNICAYITDHVEETRHIIAPNEGSAVALAAGHHLATGEIPLVYMQNSGIGNTVNPLLSLMDPLVYRIPLLLLIGWRGEPGVKDEPQHLKQGEVTPNLFDAMDIPWAILPDNAEDLSEVLEKAYRSMEERGGPYALLVRKGCFAPYSLKKRRNPTANLSREAAIERILSASEPDDIFVSTTGMASRELFELRRARKEGHNRDFLTVGSMGHASQIALGIALAKPSRRIIVLDGDGALIMHMGSLTSIGHASPKNLLHIVLNNSAHDSVGGQPTVSPSLDIPSLARASGYKSAIKVDNAEILSEILKKEMEYPALIEVLVRTGARENLGRPDIGPVENKKAFMETLKDPKGSLKDLKRKDL